MSSPCARGQAYILGGCAAGLGGWVAPWGGVASTLDRWAKQHEGAEVRGHIGCRVNEQVDAWALDCYASLAPKSPSLHACSIAWELQKPMCAMSK